MNDITSFSDKWAFLSNFYPARIKYEGGDYVTAEHAYVASKTLSSTQRLIVQMIESPGKVKRYGRDEITLREDWNEVRVAEMRKILMSKFAPGSHLHSLLLSTGDRNLIEGNTWGDTFWGQCPIGNGKNTLGKLLMEIRDDITTRFI